MSAEVWLLPVFGGVMAASWAAVGLTRSLAVRWNVLDVPNERSSHYQPVPLGGGLALLSINMSVWVLFVFVHPVISVRHLLAFSAGALIIAGISLVDDLGHVPYPIRLLCQAVAATIFISADTYWHAFAIPGLGTVSLGGFGVVLTLFWIVGLTNAFNFMDGIDGMAGGQAAAAGVGWILLGLFTGQAILFVLGSLLAASSLGFLFHNWQPAKIFMGDVGSTFLGYSFAVLAVIAGSGDDRLGLASILLVWPAIFDSGFTVLRRLREGENIFVGHRTFLFHRLVRAGWSHAAAAMLYVPLPILGALLALTWDKGTRPFHVGVTLLVASACVALWLLVRHQEHRLSTSGLIGQALSDYAPARWNGVERRSGRDRRGVDWRPGPRVGPEQRRGFGRRSSDLHPTPVRIRSEAHAGELYSA